MPYEAVWTTGYDTMSALALEANCGRKEWINHHGPSLQAHEKGNECERDHLNRVGDGPGPVESACIKSGEGNRCKKKEADSLSAERV